MTTLKSNLLKKGKKGFTLTELAIVIAVIAILIAVLVPTFTSVITSAKKTTAAENAKNAMTEFTIETYANLPDGSVVEVGDYYVTVKDGSVSADTCETISSTNEITTSSTGYVEYVWAKEVDSALSDVTIYISTTDSTALTQSIAGVIAENIADTYTTHTANAIAVSGTTSFYFTVDSTDKSVTYTATAPTGTTTDAATYVGITIYYTT